MSKLGTPLEILGRKMVHVELITATKSEHRFYPFE
jgi:hypothetical protein